MLSHSNTSARKYVVFLLMLVCALISQTVSGLANDAMADNDDLSHLGQIVSDSIRSNMIFERNSLTHLSSQLEYEKLNAQRLEQLIGDKEKLLKVAKQQNNQIHRIYLAGIGSMVLLLVALWFSHRKAINSTSLEVEADCQKEFETRLARERVRVRLETLENERDRISRNLHDGISNSLVSIRLHLRSMDEQLPEKAILSGLAEDTHREIRAIMHNLSSPSLSTIPFERLFRNHIAMMNFSKETQVDGILLPEDGWSQLNERIQTELYRLIQEITGNIVKHARASRVTVTMRRDEDCIILLAEDDGLGLIVEQDSFGFGMRNLKARIEQLNGVLQVNSSPLEGTVIRISIPNPSNSLNEPHFHEKLNLLKG